MQNPAISTKPPTNHQQTQHPTQMNTETSSRTENVYRNAVQRVSTTTGKMRSIEPIRTELLLKTRIIEWGPRRTVYWEQYMCESFAQVDNRIQ